MSNPNPPTNYNVNVDLTHKELTFSIDSGVTETRIVIYQGSSQSTIIFDGMTNTNSINIPIVISGFNNVEGTSKGSGGWGSGNKPPVSVNFH